MKRIILLSILLCAFMSGQSVAYAQSSKTSTGKNASTTSDRISPPVDVMLSYLTNATSRISKCSTLYEAQNEMSALDYNQLDFTEDDLDHVLTDSEKAKLSDAFVDFFSTAARSLGAPESNVKSYTKNVDYIINNASTIRQLIFALNCI